MPTISKPEDSNYYEILTLPRPLPNTFTSDDVKSAYHRALLRHHPDKTSPSVPDGPPHLKTRTGERYSIDQIVEAYQTLSDPAHRAAYDQGLSYGSNQSQRATQADKGTHIGVETLDLEELETDEAMATWYHACRCGDERGYAVTAEDLENESIHGEIYVGCKGCSLFIKVQFRIAEHDG